MLTDTHAHLWWESFVEDLDEVIARAKEAGVGRMIVPSTDLLSSRKAVELARQYPGTIYAAVGIHPEETIDRRLAVTENASTFNSQMRKLRQMIAENREYIAAVGEIGTDMNTEKLRGTIKAQKELLREQIEIAREAELPVILHTRKSLPETLSVLDYFPSQQPGQFHCFSDGEAEMMEVLRRGYYVSFCGNLTWSKRLRKLAELIPADRLLLETDSPLMMPRDDKGEPWDKGLRNEPKNVTMLAAIQAELRGISQAKLEEQTEANTNRLFRLG